MAVAAGMFPIMAAFSWGMSFLQISAQRRNLHITALVFLGCGMVCLLIYSWMRSEKLRRDESARQISAMRKQQQLKDTGQAAVNIPASAVGKDA